MMRSLFLLIALIIGLANAFRPAPMTTRVANQVTMKVENDAFARYCTCFASLF